jgi:hypothetical protein
VAKKIRDELAEEKTVLIHVDRDWRKFVETGDDAYLKATAYDLHGFYGGLERIFEAVATAIDGSVPGGESWHRDLLQQMGENSQESDRRCSPKKRSASWTSSGDFGTGYAISIPSIWSPNE